MQGQVKSNNKGYHYCIKKVRLLFGEVGSEKRVWLIFLLKIDSFLEINSFLKKLLYELYKNVYSSNLKDK